jgi:hypothetical protein
MDLTRRTSNSQKKLLHDLSWNRPAWAAIKPAYAVLRLQAEGLSDSRSAIRLRARIRALVSNPLVKFPVGRRQANDLLFMNQPNEKRVL